METNETATKITSTATPPQLTYFLSDQLGSTSLATDSTGVQTAELRYTPWGELRSSSGSMPTDYTYTAQRSEMDNLGLTCTRQGMFYQSRFPAPVFLGYDPAIGRFAAADSLVPGGAQGLDRYAYVNNSPVMYIDPSGHNPKCGPDGIFCDQDKSNDNDYDAMGNPGCDDLGVINVNGKKCKMVPVGEWHLSKYMMSTLSDVRTDKHVYSKTNNYVKTNICNPAGGGCEKMSLPFRFLYGAEGIIVQGTGALPDGRTIHVANWSGSYVYMGNGSIDYWKGTATFYWGPGKVNLVAGYTAAVGPSYVGWQYYIPELKTKNFNGVFGGSDRGGAIVDGRMDIYTGAGYSSISNSPIKNGDYQVYRLECKK